MLGQKKENKEDRRIRTIDQFAQAQESIVASGSPKKSGQADHYARMLMTGYNIFRPLLVAAIFSEKNQSKDVLFEITDDKNITLDAIQDVINRVTMHWVRTQDLVDHVYRDFKEVGVNLGAQENRWLLRVLLRNTADMVATAAMNGKDFDFDKVKQSCSAIVVMVTGKSVPGLTDVDVTEKLKADKNIDQFIQEAFQGDDPSYSTDDVSAIQMASFNSAMRLTEAVDKFDFFQGHNNRNERHVVVEKLNDIAIKSGVKMYQVAVGIDKNGQHNEAYTREINKDTRRQLLMRCISDSATFVEKSYNHYASKTRRSILATDDKDERYNLKLKTLREGVPFDQIEYDVKMSRRSLNDTARHSVAYLSTMLEAPLQEQSANTHQSHKEATQADAPASTKDVDSTKKTSASVDGDVRGFGYERQ